MAIGAIKMRGRQKSRIWQETGYLVLSLALASFLTTIPFPLYLKELKPLWLPMVLLLWVIYFPGLIGVGIAWLVGLWADILLGTLLGVHAVAFSLVCYVAILFQRRLSMLSLFQQALIVFLMLEMDLLVLFWIQYWIGFPPVKFSFWLSGLSTIFIWLILSRWAQQKVAISKILSMSR
jgi:rod shape-determining protein MreD